jgi:hypothetical protein
MPVMDGIATVRALRKLDPEARVLVASGLGDARGELTEERLHKPYTSVELLTALGRLLE